jgi:RNA polymerase sigma-70 factor (ECF subfamily)
VLRTEAERVEAALAELPEKQRLAVSLRLHEEMTHLEIAEVLGTSEGAARVNYHLGIKRLRERLT